MHCNALCKGLPSLHNLPSRWRNGPGGGGVHDLRTDGGLPPGFQKGTLF